MIREVDRRAVKKLSQAVEDPRVCRTNPIDPEGVADSVEILWIGYPR
jgi:hypothetical protein